MGCCKFYSTQHQAPSMDIFLLIVLLTVTQGLLPPHPQTLGDIILSNTRHSCETQTLTLPPTRVKAFSVCLSSDPTFP